MLTLRYLAALALVALFCVAGFLLVFAVISTQDRAAWLINESGRQRMRSQRIMALASELVHAPDAATRDELRRELNRMADSMARGHERLGSVEGGLIDTDAVHRLFFGREADLDGMVRHYLYAARTLAAEPPDALHRGNTHYQYIRYAGGEPLLQTLDAVVQALERASQRSVTMLSRLEMGVLVGTLLALTGAGWFIFRPMVDAVCREQALLQAANRELERLASTDVLTGAANRLRFQGRAGRQMALSRRHDMPLSLVMFDLDHFKRVNDEHGHEAGDRVLRSTARVVMDNVRRSDQLFRWGGEEFLLLLPHADLAAAAGLAEKLRGLLEHEDMGDGLGVTASFGAAELAEAESLDSWVERADQALYAAKQAGRNRVAQAPPGA
jgi:diguanylate cyclase (GGDEF)-like protein